MHTCLLSLPTTPPEIIHKTSHNKRRQERLNLQEQRLQRQGQELVVRAESSAAISHADFVKMNDFLNSKTLSFSLPSSRAKPSSSSTLTMIIHQLALSSLFPFASQPGQVACADAWLGDTGPRCVFLMAIFPFLEASLKYLFPTPASVVAVHPGGPGTGNSQVVTKLSNVGRYQQQAVEIR